MNLQSHCRAQSSRAQSSSELCSRAVDHTWCLLEQVDGGEGERKVLESISSLFDYSDGILPSCGLSVCAGRVQGAGVKAAWLHSHRELRNSLGPQPFSIDLSHMSLGLSKYLTVFEV